MNEVQVANQLRGSFDEAMLLRINEQGGRVSRSRLEEFAGDAAAASETAQQLEDLGVLVRTSMDGEVSLTAFGRRVAERIRESMLSGARRADAVQRALLSWLCDPQVKPQWVYDFVENGNPVAWGVPITKNEVSEAAELLIGRGYIHAYSTAEVGGLRPSITPDGRAALHSDVLISEYGQPHPTTISYDYSHNLTFGNQAQVGGVISGGQGNIQLIEQTIGADVRSDLADRLAELIKLADELPGYSRRLGDTRVRSLTSATRSLSRRQSPV
jgi:hypothetical protein